jgi:hypothetical protein
MVFKSSTKAVSGVGKEYTFGVVRVVADGAAILTATSRISQNAPQLGGLTTSPWGVPLTGRNDWITDVVSSSLFVLKPGGRAFAS